MPAQRDERVNGSRLNEATTWVFNEQSHIPIMSTMYLSLLMRFTAASRLVNSVNVKREGRTHVNVLDVGCADGVAATLHTSRFFDMTSRALIDYKGLELSDVALQRAQAKRFPPRHKIEFVKHDITTPWPVESDWADVVWFIEAIEHVPVERAIFTLQEAYHATRPGGQMLLSSPAPLDGRVMWPDSHDHEFSREDLTLLIKFAGWNIEDVWGTGSGMFDAVRKEGGEYYKLYEDLRRRSNHALAGTVIGLLRPDLTENLVWLCKKIK